MFWLSMHNTQYQGIFTALVTPFNKDNTLDEHSLIKLIEYQTTHAINGLVVCGSTGEGTSLNLTEYTNVINITKTAIKQKTLLIAGVSSSRTEEAIIKAQAAQAAGADCIMLAPPYYILPTQQSILSFFHAVHDAIDMDIMIYNIPKRTAVNINDATMQDICSLKRVRAIKEAGRTSTDIAKLAAKLKNTNISILNGNDNDFIASRAYGCVSGCVSVLSGIVPHLMQKAFLESAKGIVDPKVAQDILLINDIMSCLPNPVSIKYVLSLLNQCQPIYRAPLLPPDFEAADILSAVLPYIKHHNKALSYL